MKTYIGGCETTTGCCHGDRVSLWTQSSASCHIGLPSSLDISLDCLLAAVCSEIRDRRTDFGREAQLSQRNRATLCAMVNVLSTKAMRHCYMNYCESETQVAKWKHCAWCDEKKFAKYTEFAVSYMRKLTLFFEISNYLTIQGRPNIRQWLFLRRKSASFRPIQRH